MGYKVLVIGSGGREHALAWKLAESPSVEKVYIAPGNGGTRNVGENVPIVVSSEDSIVKIAQFVDEKNIDFTVVGPELPLALGIVDIFKARSLPIWGPTCAAAEIEASKAYAKHLMRDAGVATSAFRVFHSYDEAWLSLPLEKLPFVLKASGLASGKGVFPCATYEEVEEALLRIADLPRPYAYADRKIIAEEFLQGTEFSVHALSDGTHTEFFPLSQDHKRVNDGDKGENTGGMGAIAPLPHHGAENVLARMKNEIVTPLLATLRHRGSPFVGCFYPGIMMTDNGPFVLEVNARMGDPETQAYMMLLESDLFSALYACARGDLRSVTPLSWRKGYAVCVVLASIGYPNKCEVGFPIKGVKNAERLNDVVVFHAGTAWSKEEGLRTSGGRVLGVTAFGKTVQDAIGAAYEAVKRISFTGMHYRRDIGVKAHRVVIGEE